MIYIMNHHTRDCSIIEKQLSDYGEEFEVSTDNTDWYKNKGTYRWMGISTNYLRILKRPTEHRFKIIMHDDISVYPALFKKINYILMHAPEAIICFYNPTNNGTKKANASGKHVYQTSGNFWTQCLAFPTSMCEHYIEWSKKHIEMGVVAEDGMMCHYLKHNNLKAYVVMPSLIQHEGFNKSTFGISGVIGKNRRNSFSFDKDFDVHAIDWKKEFADPYNEGSVYRNNKGLKNL